MPSPSTPLASALSPSDANGVQTYPWTTSSGGVTVVYDDDGEVVRVRGRVSAIEALAKRAQTASEPRVTERAPIEEGPVMTVPELATLLRVRPHTIYAAIRAGEIPGAKRVGRLLRIDRASVERWMQTQDGRARR